MNVFNLKRLETVKLRDHAKKGYYRGGKKIRLGGAHISEWLGKKSSPLGEICLGLAAFVWILVFFGLTGVFPQVFASLGVGLFVLTHVILFMGEIAIGHETKERYQVLLTLWVPPFLSVLAILAYRFF